MDIDDLKVDNHAPIISDNAVESILKEIAVRNPLWTAMTKNLLATEPDSIAKLKSDAFLHLEETIHADIDLEAGQSTLGALSRPYYRTVTETLNACFRSKGKFPNEMQISPFTTLCIANSSRILELETQLERAALELEIRPGDIEAILLKLFQDVIRPSDMRTFLLLRTTQGSTQLDVMPPSLEQCLESFTRLHKVHQPSSRRGVKPSILTVGAKAFSKHVHRDLKSEFWGICEGTEKTKNETANIALAKIMKTSIWRNLHELPHRILAYEIRNPKGYGARWTAAAYDPSTSNASWIFRGFLEPPMEDGHSVGWIH